MTAATFAIVAAILAQPLMIAAMLLRGFVFRRMA
jgi:hypothetical protein